MAKAKRQKFSTRNVRGSTGQVLNGEKGSGGKGEKTKELNRDDVSTSGNKKTQWRKKRTQGRVGRAKKPFKIANNEKKGVKK